MKHVKIPAMGGAPAQEYFKTEVLKVPNGTGGRTYVFGVGATEHDARCDLANRVACVYKPNPKEKQA